MATVLNNLNANVSIASAISSAVGSLGSSTFPFSKVINFALGNGSGAALLGNQMIALSGTIAGGAHTDVDLYANSAAVDAVGNAVTMTVVKFLFIQNLGSGTPVEADVMKIGAIGATTQWTSFFGVNTDSIILPGPLGASGLSFLMVGANGATAYAVGNSSTNHLLRLASTGANTISYNLVAIGATA